MDRWTGEVGHLRARQVADSVGHAFLGSGFLEGAGCWVLNRGGDVSLQWLRVPPGQFKLLLPSIEEHNQESSLILADYPKVTDNWQIKCYANQVLIPSN